MKVSRKGRKVGETCYLDVKLTELNVKFVVDVIYVTEK